MQLTWRSASLSPAASFSSQTTHAGPSLRSAVGIRKTLLSVGDWVHPSLGVSTARR